ncbi:MAG: hypothetical protein K8T25_07710 [Planctomycetia bacterium]|nr:hypothetical protein [Planctomycetia bacterium]
MMRSNPNDVIHRFFAGLTEYAFFSRVGLADPIVVDYVTELLARFIRCDEAFGIRDPSGRRLGGLARLLAEAELRVGPTRRQLHRHIGDFALFWAGLYPEALDLVEGPPRDEQFHEYCSHGKRAYFIASTLPPAKDDADSQVLLKLSTEFETCVSGLGEVRREWERRDASGGPGPVLLN